MRKLQEIVKTFSIVGLALVGLVSFNMVQSWVAYLALVPKGRSLGMAQLQKRRKHPEFFTACSKKYGFEAATHYGATNQCYPESVLFEPGLSFGCQQVRSTQPTPKAIQLTHGKYMGHKWHIDENHLMWWDGKPYVPFGGFGIKPGNEFGLNTYNLWIDFDPFIEKPRYTRKQHREDIAKKLDAITEAGGTCIVQFSMALPHIPEGPKPGMRWREPEGGIDGWRLANPEVKRAILKVWEYYAPAVRKECVRAIVLWNEINVWRWPERMSVEKYGQVLSEYAREVKRMVGDLPVCFKVAGTWNAAAVVAGAATADGLGFDVWFTKPDDTSARQEIERALRMLQARQKKTSWFFIAEGGRGIAEGGTDDAKGVEDYWDNWPPFRSKQEAKGILQAYARAGAKGFIYNGPSSDSKSHYHDSYRWLGELKPQITTLMVVDTAPEKLVLGFEKEELARGDAISWEEKPGRESWFYLLEQPEGFDFAARFEWPGATNRAWTWRCRPGTHTEGELALVTTVAPANPKKLAATYQQTDFLSHFYPNLRDRFEAYPLMTTFQWLARSNPSLRDWSGYDLLRVDVRCDAAPAELWLALEDETLEPPVMRTYKIPPGKWLTIELDLNDAVRTRGLELAKIANFWLLGRAPVRTEIRIDNIRIVKRGIPAAKELVRDESPMTFSVARPRRPQMPDLPQGLKPDRTPIRLTEPVVVTPGSIVPFGWVAAYDNRYIFVAYSAKDRAEAVYTDDGGYSWKQLPEPAIRNLDHGTDRGCAIDVTGDGVAVSSGPGCAGLGYANPRQHLTKYTFTGRGWQAERPVILDSDIRHCGSNVSVVRLRSGPHKGRLWASWGEIGRTHRIGVHAKFSDDDGRTWVPWGKGAAIPGSQAAEWSDGTYGYPETVITPYKNHVACFWRHKRDAGVVWSVYNGSDWSPPSEVSPVSLDDMDGAYRATMSAVTKGETEVFFTATGLSTVLRWDGRSWTAAPIQCEDGGMLSLAGDVVTLFTAGKVNRRWKGLDWSRRATLRYYRRSQTGQWEGPLELVGEFNIHEYRSLAGFCVPQYAPANFVPLVWSDYDEGTVKLLKVGINLRTSNKMRLLRRYAPRNDNDRMSLRAKRSNLNDCTEQDHFILLEALSSQKSNQKKSSL